jgi:hypothetical protein
MGAHHLALPEPHRPSSYRAPQLNPNELLRERTLPWADDQLCRVNGLRCCYSHRDGLMVVHLPGGESVTVAEIMRRGWTFEPPRWLRTEHFA